MLVYLAGAVDQVSADHSRGWRETATRYFATYNIGTFSPPHAFSTPRGMSAEAQIAVLTTNELALVLSGCVLGNLTLGSFGTPVECEDARKAEKPVMLFGDDLPTRHSLYLARYEHVFNTLQEAMQEVVVEAMVRESDRHPAIQVNFEDPRNRYRDRVAMQFQERWQEICDR